MSVTDSTVWLHFDVNWYTIIYLVLFLVFYTPNFFSFLPIVHHHQPSRWCAKFKETLILSPVQWGLFGFVIRVFWCTWPQCVSFVINSLKGCCGHNFQIVLSYFSFLPAKLRPRNEFSKKIKIFLILTIFKKKKWLTAILTLVLTSRILKKCNFAPFFKY